MATVNSLRSSALMPGEPEYKTELHELNLTLLNIPKDVDVRKLVNFRPLQPKHSVALQDMHSQIFPIRYDPRFFEAACGTENESLFDTHSYWSSFSLPSYNHWDDNQIMAIGIFFPKKYLDYNKMTGSYDIDSYLIYLKNTSLYYTYDHSLDPTYYDPEFDEYIVGFATILINLNITNNLISDEDYYILYNYYRDKLNPAIKDGSLPKGSLQGVDNKEKHITDCAKLNTSFMDNTFYQVLYNQLYNNDTLIRYIRRFNMNDMKTLYILSAGITLGLRKRLLGTTLILFIQVMVYFISFNLFLFENKFYHSLVYSDALKQRLSVNRRLLESIQFHYNTLSLSQNRHVDLYYEHVIHYRRHYIGNSEIKAGELIEYRTNKNDCTDEKMPLALYLHAISYNDQASNMYQRLNFSHITTIENYYTIKDTKFAANFLAHFIVGPENAV